MVDRLDEKKEIEMVDAMADYMVEEKVKSKEFLMVFGTVDMRAG